MAGQPVSCYTYTYKFNINLEKWLILQHYA